MVKNLRIQTEFLSLIDSLLNILKNDVGRIKTGEKDYSFCKKLSRNSLIERLVLRSYPHYLNLARTACLDGGDFGALAEVQKLNERFVEYSTHMYDINNLNNNYRTGKQDAMAVKSVAPSNYSNCFNCSVTLDDDLWNGLNTLAKSLSAGLGMEMNISNLIKGCMVKGINFYVKMAETNVEIARKIGMVACDFTSDLKDLKKTVSDLVHKLDTNENPLSKIKTLKRTYRRQDKSLNEKNVPAKNGSSKDIPFKRNKNMDSR